ncbi:MAG: hypothetical protein E7471_01865, partial [Ruminococcaceae bacterium]|nr:hypothetical protein [Oscillospiraceae bacterium]
MKHKMHNRLLALLLVVCMLVAFVPSGLAAEGEVGKNYNFNMGRLQWGQWSNEGVAPQEITDWDALEALGNFHNRTSDPFMYYGKEGKISTEWNSSSADASKGFGPRGTGITGDEGAWYGLILRIDESGVYTPVMRTADQVAATQLNFYLAPFGVENPKAEQYFIGQSKAVSADPYSLRNLECANQYIEAGDYILIIEIAKNNQASNAYGYFASAKFNWVSATPSESLILSGSVPTGYIDEEVELTVSATLDGEGIALSDLDAVRIDSLDKEVATVREEDGKYYVFGMWEGETEIRLSATHGTEAYAVDIPLTIAMPAGYARVEIWPGAQLDEYVEKEPYTIEMNYTLNREDVVLSPEDITVELADPSIADILVEASGDLTVTGTKSGSTTATVSVDYQGGHAEIELPITVSDVKFFYNFYRGYYGPWSNSAHPIDYFTDFGMHVKGEVQGVPNNWEESDEWKFGGKSPLFDVQVTQSFRSYAYWCKGGPGDWINMVIRVPESGSYRVDALTATMAAGARLNVYMSPVGTPEDEWKAEKYYLGEMLCSAAGQGLDVHRDLGNVTLDAGDYNVVYEFKPGMQAGNGGFLCGLYLKALREDQFKLFAETPKPIAETANGTVPLVSRWNGESVGFADVTDLTVKSANESIATATVVQDGDEAYLDVHGVAPGKTVLTVSGVREGLSASYSINVDIAEAKRIYAIDLSAEKSGIASNESIATVLTGTYYDGTPIDFEGLDVYYQLADGKILGISPDGTVTGKEKGETVVTAWVQQKLGGTNHLLHSSMNMEVTTYSNITKAEFNIPEEISRGDRIDLNVDLELASGLIPTKDMYQVTFTAENESVSGLVRIRESGSKIQLTALKNEGTVDVVATVNFNGNDFVFRKTLTITPNPASSGSSAVAPDRAVVEITKPLLIVGESREAKIGVYYTDASFASYDPAKMTLTYDDTVISYADGKIRAIGVGETDIVLTMGDLSATTKVVVNDDVIGLLVVKQSADLYAGKTVNLTVSAKTEAGRDLASSDLILTYASDNEDAVTVASGVLTGVAAGEANITVTAHLAGAEQVVATATIPVVVYANNVENIKLTCELSAIKPDNTDGIQTQVSVVYSSGDVVPADVSNLSFESLDEDLFSVDQTGLVRPLGKEGTGVIRATFMVNGEPVTSDLQITARWGKASATYFTAERRAAIQENRQNFDWAQQSYESVDGNAKKVLEHDVEWYLQFMTTQELPRSIWPTYRYDPIYTDCVWCGDNVVQSSGEYYPWLFDNENYPWKIQCPTCRRRFPSNDFGEFYKTGIDENGNWSYELAKQNGSHLLVNEDYPEKDEYVDKDGKVHNQGVHGWGVDDGYGWKTGEYFDGNNGTVERRYIWIAYWNHWANWYSTGTTYSTLSSLAYGYAYTGNKEYGRMLAILIDRVADLYPDMDLDYFGPNYYNNGWYGGRIVGGIWETGVANMLSKAYDSAFDMYDDEYVKNYIQAKDEKYGLPAKETANDIRVHIEDNLLREIRKGVLDKRINGNTGMHEGTMAIAGVVLDNMPESKEMIDWALTDGPDGVLNNLISLVNRDGQGDENSPGYNILWVDTYNGMADTLSGYTAYPAANLYTNPKFIKMIKMNFPLTMSRYRTALIGDTGKFASTGFQMATAAMGQALANGSDDPEIAQYLYFLNGNSASGPNGRSMMVPP